MALSVVFTIGVVGSMRVLLEFFFVINYTYTLPPLVMLDKYTYPNIFIAKHNGDDKPHDASYSFV